MKAELIEHEGCFEIGFEPETVEDAARLIRFRINATRDLRGIYAYAHRDGTFSGSVVLGKRKEDTSSV